MTTADKAEGRPVLTAKRVLRGPGATEAMNLYGATSSLPLRKRWGTIPASLAAYLELIYTGGEQDLIADIDLAPAEPWATLTDNGTCWIAFTGGKDSVAAAIEAQARGYKPVLYHLAGLNRGMLDELGYATAISAATGWPLVVERVHATGKKSGVIELPTKNQVTALFMLNRMAREGGAVWSAGWHRDDEQTSMGYGYSYSDGNEAITRFNSYLEERYPGATYIWTTADREVGSWATVAGAGLIELVKGCVCPPRFKEQRRGINVAKFGELLNGRCGSCIKCGWEQATLEDLGVISPRPDLRKHGAQFIVKDYGARYGKDPAVILEHLSPPELVEKHAQPFGSWPPQVSAADWAGRPATRLNHEGPHVNGFIHPTIEHLTVDIDELVHYGKNPRKGDVEKIAESLERNGQYKPVTVRKGTNEVLAGNHTLKAAKVLGWSKIAATYVEVDDDSAARIVLADNRTSDLGRYDDEQLQELLAGLGDLEGTGYTEDDLLRDAAESAEEASQNSSLVERFGAPPFTVLDARSGYWTARKQAWKEMGIDSGEGRDDTLIYTSLPLQFSNWYIVKTAAEEKEGRELTDQELAEKYGDKLNPLSGTSIFDPVLCELLYRWYSPAGGHVIDPWAGGSVRGLVAARLGRSYTGIELREEQVGANRVQAKAHTNGPLPATLAAAPGKHDTPSAPDDPTPPRKNPTPKWIIGESSEQLVKLPEEAFDFAIGCPPYYDLEVYSDDPRDMSNLTREQFDDAMRENIRHAADRLKPDSFAAFIVGAVRDGNGNLMDMRSLMVDACERAGMKLANDAILITPVGTAAFRAPAAFKAKRTLARTHQDVLVFVKGDRKRATERLGDMEIDATLESLNKQLENAHATEEDSSAAEAA